MSHGHPRGNRQIDRKLMKNEEYEHVVLAQFHRLPPTNSKFIKIFLSSTFSDLSTERNHLMSEVYPRLKEYCRTRYGIEFQVVDMRWGVRQEAQYDHQGPQLCYEELRNCQAVSAGPSFLTILGQRYGSHPPPYSIPSTEFLEVLDTLEKEETGESIEAVSVLKEWYEEDKNYLPSEYVLRPIAENVHEMEDSALKVAKEKWDAAEPVITKSLTAVAQKWHDTGRYPPDHCQKYFCSVTEQEIILGILDPVAASMSRRYAAAFLRSMADIESHLQDERASRFVDMMKDSSSGRHVLHSHLQLLMRNLCEVKLKQHLPQSRIFPYQESWNSVVEEGEAREKYLRHFSEDFVSCCQSLVDESMQQRSEFASDDLYVETLQHFTLCVKYVRHFKGRQEILQILKEYITGPLDEPLVVHGQSGSGKTSVLAKCASEARNWLHEEEREHAVILLRFLGTSPGTSNVRRTLQYLCRQLAYFSSEADQETAKKLDSMKDISDFFTDILSRVSFFRKVLLFLDSLDQLDSSDSCHHLNWLPAHLPENVKLVVSTLPDMFGLLHTLRSRMLNEDLFVEVTPLETDVCIQILQAQLQEVNRQLTEPQWNVLKVAFEKCSLPIFVTLMLHQAKTWRSFFPATDTRLCVEHSVRGAILQLFSNLEKKHGKVLVRHALGYITASRNGLTETELEDLLSLDDEVLRDVFLFHLPPQMRIPPFCWSRLRHDISNYLVEREADGVRVLNWYHRQFIEAARDVFLEDDQEIKQKIHSLMADYFLGVWSGERKKPFQYPDYLKKKLKLPDCEEKTRHVPKQPFVFEESAPYETTLNNGDIRIRVNLRKLNELTKHLVNANRLEECFSEIVFNYDFLFNKLRGTSRHELLEDIQRVASICGDDLNGESVKLVFNAIRIASESLNYNSHNLRVDLLGRLLPFVNSHPLISRLLQSCDTEGGRHSVLRPRCQILDSGSGDIHTTFDMPMSLAVVLPGNLICTLSRTDKLIRLYDTNGNLLRCVESNYYLLAGIKQLGRGVIPPDCTVNVALKPERPKESPGEETDEELPSGEEAEEERPEEEESDEDDPYDCVDFVRVNLSTGKTEKLFSMPLYQIPAVDSVKYSGRGWAVAERGGCMKIIDIAQKSTCLIFSRNGLWSISSSENALAVLDSEDGGNGSGNTDWSIFTLYMLPGLTRRYVKQFPVEEGVEMVCHCCYSNLEVVGVVKESSGVDESKYFLVRFLPKDSAEENGDGELKEFQRYPVPENFIPKRKIQNQPVCSPSEDRIFLMNHNFSMECPTFGYIWNRVTEQLTPLTAEWDSAMEFEYIEAFVTKERSTRVLPVYSADEELIIFNGNSILNLVFSTVTGEMMRYMNLAESTAIVAGVTQNPNLLVLSCILPTMSDKSDSSVVCRIYNIDEFKKKQMTAKNLDHILEKETATSVSVDLTWNLQQSKLVPFSGDPLNDLSYFGKGSNHFLMDFSDPTEPVSFSSLLSNCNDFIFLHIHQTGPTEEVFSIHTNSSTESYFGVSKMYYYAVDYSAKTDTPWTVREGTPLDVVHSRTVINYFRAHRPNESMFSILLPDRELMFQISWLLFIVIDESQECIIAVSSLKNLCPLKKITVKITPIEDSPNFQTLDEDEEENEVPLSTKKTNDSKWKFDSKLHGELELNELRLIQILPRPGHHDQLVLVAHLHNDRHNFMCALREMPHLTRENLFNPGIFLILDYSDLSKASNYNVQSKLCWSDIFGPVVLLEDGLHAINYRLQVVNIETGLPVRHIRPPEEEIYLQGLMPLLNNKFICGVHMPAIVKVTLAGYDDDSSMQSDVYSTSLCRTLRVYRLADGALVGDYLFTEEALALHTNSTRSCVFFLANNVPLAIVDLDTSHLVPPHGFPHQGRKSFLASNNSNSEPNQEIFKSGSYLAEIGLEPILKKAYLELVEKRPSDPITHLAEYLRTHYYCSRVE